MTTYDIILLSNALAQLLAAIADLFRSIRR